MNLGTFLGIRSTVSGSNLRSFNKKMFCTTCCCKFHQYYCTGWSSAQCFMRSLMDINTLFMHWWLQKVDECELEWTRLYVKEWHLNLKSLHASIVSVVLLCCFHFRLKAQWLLPDKRSAEKLFSTTDRHTRAPCMGISDICHVETVQTELWHHEDAMSPTATRCWVQYSRQTGLWELYVTLVQNTSIVARPSFLTHKSYLCASPPRSPLTWPLSRHLCPLDSQS